MKGAILKFYKITYPFAMLWMTYAVFFNSDLGWEFYAGMIAYVFFGLSMFDDVRGYRVDIKNNYGLGIDSRDDICTDPLYSYNPCNIYYND